MGGVGSYEVGEAWALSGPVLSRGPGISTVSQNSFAVDYCR